MAEKRSDRESDDESDRCSPLSMEEDFEEHFSPMPFTVETQNGKGTKDELTMYSKDGASDTQSKRTKSVSTPEQSGSTLRPGSKRKADEAFLPVGEVGGIVSELPTKGASAEPPPPLDPEIDSLIDSVLAVGESTVLGSPNQREEAWRSQGPITRQSHVSVSSDEEEGGAFDKADFFLKDEPPPLDPATDSLIDSFLSGGEASLLHSLALDEETAPPPLDPDVDLAIESLLAKEEKALLFDLRTEDNDPFSPLDEGVDALIESMLAGGEDGLLADASTLVDEDMIWEEDSKSEPGNPQIPGKGDASGASTAEMHSETAWSSPHSEAGPSSGLAQLSGPKSVSPKASEGLDVDDWLGRGDVSDVFDPAEALLTVKVLPGLPFHSEKLWERVGEALSTLTDDSIFDPESHGLPDVLGAEGGSPYQTSYEEQSSTEHFEVSPVGTPAPPQDGQAAGESTVSSSSSSSGASSVQSQPSGAPEAEVAQRSGATGQPAPLPSSVLPMKFLGWVDQVYPGISDEDLSTHPFYHIPMALMKFLQTTYPAGSPHSNTGDLSEEVLRKLGSSLEKEARQALTADQPGLILEREGRRLRRGWRRGNQRDPL
ncbi:hypothetical protein, conserved [Eimeria praecox]|uniref:Uncharacterized protein n=1 Tax=Eimeria praecox TaxID=51316 RepID=U6G111_9EIME|nr:hypothetical protein, conserved [Eimeria praecox]